MIESLPKNNSTVAFSAPECTNVVFYGIVIFVYLLTRVLLSNLLQRLNLSYQSSTVNHTEIILNKFYSRTWYLVIKKTHSDNNPNNNHDFSRTKPYIKHEKKAINYTKTTS